MFKIILFVSCLAMSAVALDFEYGRGNFAINGGVVGMDHEIDADVTSYRVSQEHFNLGDTAFFASANVMWFELDKVKSPGGPVNGMWGALPVKMVVSAIDYDISGVDANFMLGMDLLHESDEDYLGIGGLVGISFPVVENSSGNYSLPSLPGMPSFDIPASENKYDIFRVGIGVDASRRLGRYMSLYGSGGLAYQYVDVENGLTTLGMGQNGSYRFVDVGMRFGRGDDKNETKRGWGLPGLFAKAGWRYIGWEYDKSDLKAFGHELSMKLFDLKMETNIFYFGIGMDF